MTAPLIPDGDFIKLFREIGPSKLTKRLDTHMGGVMRRRRYLEGKYGTPINPPSENVKSSHIKYHMEEFPGRLHHTVKNGIVIVGSDIHAWPGPRPTAFRAFIKFIKKMQPMTIVLNGDCIDGASISRHPPLGWERNPTLLEELEAAQALLHEIELAAPKRAELFWPCGNHDARLSTKLATVAPEYAGIPGTSLKDHFGERWQPCWSVWINDGPECVIKHRPQSGGVHASYNMTLKSGVTTVHGHLHSLKAVPFTDYRGRRYSVDCGCLADIYGPQFGYLEDGPRNWSSGFAVLTFRDGEMLQPELCVVKDKDTVEWRGERIRV